MFSMDICRKSFRPISVHFHDRNSDTDEEKDSKSFDADFLIAPLPSNLTLTSQPALMYSFSADEMA